MARETKTKTSPAPKAAKPAKAAATETAVLARGTKRTLQGLVVSDKMQKTIVVKVDRRVQHSRYPKIVTSSNKYKAHDEKREAKTGDRVEIIECRPMSRDKRWALSKILAKAKVSATTTV